MDDIFKNTEPKKRDRIINSALEEFSKNSYEKASTNKIVEKAGISKGLLYHYFDSKKCLYKFLEVFAIKTTVNAVINGIDWNESDLFKRFKQILLIKIKVFQKYPYLPAFVKTMYEHKSLDEIKEMAETHVPGIYQETYSRNIDFTLFKDTIDMERVMKMTQWVMEKLGEEWITTKITAEKSIDYKELKDDIDGYLSLLRETFYKQTTSNA